MFVSIRAAAFAFSALVALSSARQALAAPPPAEAFGRTPAVQDAKISPDGKRIAILGDGPGGARAVSITPIDSQQVATLNLGDVVSRDIRWASPDYVLVRASYYVVSPFSPKTPLHFERRIVVDVNAKPLNRLGVNGDINDYASSTPLLGVVDKSNKPFAVLQGWDQTEANVARVNDTHFKNKAAVVTPALFKVDIKSGKATSIIERGTINTDTWAVDTDGEARARIDINDTTHDYLLMGRKKGSGSWQTIEHSTNEEDSRNFVGYSDPEDAIYTQVQKPDGTAMIVRHNLADGTTTNLSPSEPASGIGVVWDANTRGPVAMVTTDGINDIYDWLDKDIGAIHEKLSHAFKGKQVSLINWSVDRTRFVVEVESGDAPPSYYLLDSVQKSLSPLGDAYPELKGVALGHKSYFTYKAADGLEIPAYLTLPPGAPATGGKLPLIVLPHGGPAARDDAGFDWWAQFLASRGYAVLQPQFRGSTGFGRAFEEAGRKEWSGKMQTDLIDGVQALAAKGVVDPARVCIAGASYGGYAALAGATLHADTYRCAISVNGVSDVGALLNQDIRLGGYDSGAIRYWRRQLGWGRNDTISPDQIADRAKNPILLIHAKEDTTVYYEQSEKMLAALRDKAKPVEMVTLAGDDHYLSDAASRITMLRAIDAFLAKNLPVAR